MRSTVLSDRVMYEVHSAVRQCCTRSTVLSDRVLYEVHSAVRQSDV